MSSPGSLALAFVLLGSAALAAPPSSQRSSKQRQSGQELEWQAPAGQPAAALEQPSAWVARRRAAQAPAAVPAATAGTAAKPATVAEPEAEMITARIVRGAHRAGIPTIVPRLPLVPGPASPIR